MLVLTRKVGQGFFIGDDTWVQLVQASNGQAKIGIRCPNHVLVLRSELYGMECNQCHGKLLVAGKLCSKCNGTGRIK